MVKLPGADSVPTVSPRIQRGPMVDFRAANVTAVPEALAQVGNAISGVATQVAEHFIRQQRLADGTAITERQIAFDRASGDELTRAQTEDDFSTPEALGRFDSFLSKQVETSLQSLPKSTSDRAREDLRLKLESRRTDLYQSAQIYHLGQLKASANAAFGDRSNEISAWAQREPDRLEDWLAERDGALENFAGALSPEQEALARQNSTLKIVHSAVMGFAEQGNFDEARRLIADQRFDDVFTPDQRNALLDSALRLSEERDRVAEATANKAKENRASELRIGIMKGQIKPADLVTELEKRTIDNSQFDTLLRFARGEDAEVSDDALALDLRFRIYNGELGPQDLLPYRGRLTRGSMESLLGLADQMDRREGVIERADVQRERRRVDQIIGGVRGPLAVLDSGASERMANALDDFDQRVLKGENPREVADSVIDRFRQSPVSLNSLPKPKYWGGNVGVGSKEQQQAQIAAAQRATNAALAAGQISQDEFIREMRNLERFSEVVAGMEK